MPIEDKQYEKINFTFPVLIEWLIEYEKIPNRFENEYMSSKLYNVPGFPWFTYTIKFETKLNPENFIIEFWRNVFNESCEWESNLCLTTNNGEPKKSSIVELKKAKKFILDPIPLRINGTITVLEILKPYNQCTYIPSSCKFQELEEPKDFIIEVEKQEIQVHKKVLQFYSPVFSAMFENGWKEASEGRVVISEFPFKIVKTAVDMCYSEDLWSKTKNPELILLYRFADKYDIDEIKYAIKEIIWLTPNNICEYANLFYDENCPVFVNHCIDRLIVYFQFSYPVKDLETLNTDIKLQFFTQASVSQAMKKEFMSDYHKNLNDEDFNCAHPLL